MKVSDVRIGKVYLTQVNGRPTPVRILREEKGVSGYTYWEATNLISGGLVRVRSPRHLKPAPAGRE